MTVVPMMGAFWNVRGLNKSGRLQCISDFINIRITILILWVSKQPRKTSLKIHFLNYINIILIGATSLLIALLEVS